MNLMEIPLEPIPNQEVEFRVGDDNYTVNVITRSGSLYITVWREGEYIVNNRALMSFAPVTNNIQLIDTEGTEDPNYEGLGTRWLLVVDTDYA